MPMSSQEFTSWAVWLDAEQIGPEWDRLRHAELMAACSNGGQFQRNDKQPFKAADFLPPDPWEPPAKPLTAAQERARLTAEVSGMEDLFG